MKTAILFLIYKYQTHISKELKFAMPHYFVKLCL